MGLQVQDPPLPTDSILPLLLLLPLELTLLTVDTPFTVDTWSPFFFTALIYLNLWLTTTLRLPIHISAVRYVQQTISPPRHFITLFRCALAYLVFSIFTFRKNSTGLFAQLRPWVGAEYERSFAHTVVRVELYCFFLVVEMMPTVVVGGLCAYCWGGWELKVSEEAVKSWALYLKVQVWIWSFIDFTAPRAVAGDWTRPWRQMEWLKDVVLRLAE